MKFRQTILLFCVLFTFSGCDIAKEVGGAYNITQCKYNYNSVSKMSLAGMDLSNGISLIHIPQLTSLLSGNAKSLPLNFTLNLDVNNPNQAPALLHGMQYILSIDKVQFTSGIVNQSLNIPAGGKQVLPINIGVDLATLMKGESKDAVTSIAKNVMGLSNNKSEVTLQLKPTFMIGGHAITSPTYIPVNFSFGGK